MLLLCLNALSFKLSRLVVAAHQIQIHLASAIQGRYKLTAICIEWPISIWRQNFSACVRFAFTCCSILYKIEILILCFERFYGFLQGHVVAQAAFGSTVGDLVEGCVYFVAHCWASLSWLEIIFAGGYALGLAFSAIIIIHLNLVPFQFLLDFSEHFSILSEFVDHFGYGSDKALHNLFGGIFLLNRSLLFQTHKDLTEIVYLAVKWGSQTFDFVKNFWWNL